MLAYYRAQLSQGTTLECQACLGDGADAVLLQLLSGKVAAWGPPLLHSSPAFVLGGTPVPTPSRDDRLSGDAVWPGSAMATPSRLHHTQTRPRSAAAN